MASKLDFRLLLDRLGQFDLSTITKYSWILHLLIVFLLAKSLSNLFVNYMDYKMEAPKMAATSKSLPKSQEKPYPPQEEFKKITKRNIFNPNAPEESDAIAIPKGAGAFEEAGATPTTLPIELVGTIILSDGNKSVAAIKDKTGNKTESYQVGDILLAKAKVFKVDAYKVYLQNLDNQSLEFVEKKIEDTLTPSLETTASTGEGIRESGDGRFVIDRGALESSIANPNEILTQARAIPNIVDGKIKGFRILSIKPGSVYEKLGIRNGDVIEEVNGIALDSPAKALEFYGAISSASDISLNIERDGQKKSFSYTIK